MLITHFWYYQASSSWPLRSSYLQGGTGRSRFFISTGEFYLIRIFHSSPLISGPHFAFSGRDFVRYLLPSAWKHFWRVCDLILLAGVDLCILEDASSDFGFLNCNFWEYEDVEGYKRWVSEVILGGMFIFILNRFGRIIQIDKKYLGNFSKKITRLFSILNRKENWLKTFI